jgi:diaminopimelate epimerase
LHFTKMNGAGNDFVVVDNRNLSLPLDRAQIARICDRHRGIGADGLLAVEPAEGRSDFRMRYYNADGGEVEMCGNGARCFARFVNRLHNFSLERVSFETIAGVITAEFVGDHVKLTMSDPIGIRLDEKLGINGRVLTVHLANTGVPHAVVFVDDLENVDVLEDGRALRNHERFAPNGTNANFAFVAAPGRIAIRTYERGVENETLACGTGTIACAIIHHLVHGAEAPIAVSVRGGETLVISFQHAGERFRDVTLTGPADIVFDGEMKLP